MNRSGGSDFQSKEAHANDCNFYRACGFASRDLVDDQPSEVGNDKARERPAPYGGGQALQTDLRAVGHLLAGPSTALYVCPRHCRDEGRDVAAIEAFNFCRIR